MSMGSASTATALSLGRRVVRVLTTARTPDDAARGVLREVAEPFGWSAGVLWLLDVRTGLLRPAGDWVAGDHLDELRATLNRLTFATGVGVPGEVFESLTPRWLPDLDRGRLTDDAELPRGETMLAAGVRAVIAVPVVSGDGPVGVMEFLATAPEPESRERIDAITLVGQQLAEYLSRVRVEERLRRSEASSASIVRAALDCIVTMDHRGRVVDLNPAAETVFGYRRDDVIGERLADLIIPPALRDAHQRSVREYVETGQASILNRRLELEGMRADGTTFPAELTVTRLGISDPPVFAGFIRDITDRRQADEQRARLIETLQRTLLPPHLPEVPGLELGAAYRAGSEGLQVGGDFYDVFELERGRWALVLGDVSGKGVEAAVLTSALRHAARAAAVRHREPRDVVAALNRAMLRDTGRGEFFTAVYATLELAADAVRVCLTSSGHPLPLLVRGRDVQPVGRPGTLLGAFGAITAHQAEVVLRGDDLLVLYTDGVTEAKTPDGRFGTDRLMSLLSGGAAGGAAGVAAGIEAAVLGATDGRVNDDLAVLAVRASS